MDRLENLPRQSLRIFVSGSKERKEQLRAYLGIDAQAFDQLCTVECERMQACEDVNAAVEIRKNSNPLATPFEYSLGCYLEAVEPQVRDCVIELRKKGYATIGSGFTIHPWNQYIQWLSSERSAYVPPNIAERLAEEGFEVKISTFPLQHMGLPFSHSIDVKKFPPPMQSGWEEMWKKVADLMPDLGTAVPPCINPISERFREEQRLTFPEKVVR